MTKASAIRNALFALFLAALFSPAAMAAAGEDLKVINKTGRTVVAFLFQDDHPNLDPDEGVQFGVLKNGESAIAHVPNCTFEILLVDKEDVWHWELHDCKSPSITFTSTTGAGKREHHKK